MQEKRLFDAEYKFMDILWEMEPINSTQLARICEDRLGWKKPTTYNMLRKLGEKGVVRNERATVTALIKREDVRQAESEALMERAFGGSVPLFVATLLGGRKLTREEADSLKRMIEEAAQ